MKTPVAYFEITNKCNLNCQTCYNRSGLNAARHEITLTQLQKAVKTLLPFGLRRVLLSGGEPTLHTEFNDILDFIEETLNKNPEFSFGIVTNGSSRNPKFIELLNKNERLTLQVSLDGSNEVENAKTRDSGSFAEAVDFIRFIDKRAHKTHLNIPFQPLLKMVISQYNIHDVEAFFRLAVSLGFVPEFSYIYKSGNASDNWEEKRLTAQQKLNILRLVNKLNSELGVEALLPLCTNTCPYAENADAMSICVKVDGSIQPCQSLYNDKYTFGNIFDFDLQMFKQKVDDFVKLAKERIHCDYNCRKCLLRDNCGKGCLAEAVNLFDDPLSDDGGCEFRKLQFLGFDLPQSKFFYEQTTK